MDRTCIWLVWKFKRSEVQIALEPVTLSKAIRTYFTHGLIWIYGFERCLWSGKIKLIVIKKNTVFDCKIYYNRRLGVIMTARI